MSYQPEDDNSQAFECVSCGDLTSPDRGAHSAIERALEDGERGVCDDCFAKLPTHVHDWAKDRVLIERKGGGDGG